MPTLTHSNWRIRYDWSASSGLRLGNCEYMGVRVIHAASVPFVYVSYAGDAAGPFTDRLRSERRRVERRDIMRGIDLTVRYDLYGEDYQYEHTWRFHSDGQFGTSVIIRGPGEELAGRHVYHLPFRFDLDVSGAAHDSFQERAGGSWRDVRREGRRRSIAAPAYEWRLLDKTSRRSIDIRGRAGDGAELWALRYKERESWGSWGGAAAGIPGTPGGVPAVYDDNESVQDTNVVLWYIAHVPAVDRVSACGPWFRVRGYPNPPPDDEDGHGPGGHG